jgi:hypothetical protein
MKIYIATIDPACLEYGYVFLVKEENKKVALQKVYDYCKKKEYNYKKSEITIKLPEEIFKDFEGVDVAEIV